MVEEFQVSRQCRGRYALRPMLMGDGVKVSQERREGGLGASGIQKGIDAPLGVVGSSSSSHTVGRRSRWCAAKCVFERPAEMRGVGQTASLG
jgi:hypothetical protein